MGERCDPATNLAVCSGCDKSFHPANLMWCAGCKVDRYCDASCQRSHWPQHKQVCKARRAARKRPAGADANERGNALVMRFERLSERGRADEAKAALDEALELGHPRAIHMKARCLVDEGDVDGGIALFERMLREGLGEGEAGCNAGLLEYNAGRARMTRAGPDDLARAIELFDVALRKNPTNGGVYHMRGVALGMVGRANESLAAFEQSIACFEGREAEAASAHFNAGRCRFEAGEYAAAADHFRAVLRATPGDWAANHMLQGCEQAQLLAGGPSGPSRSASAPAPAAAVPPPGPNYAAEVGAMSVKELRAEARLRGVPIDDCLEKRDIVARLVSAGVECEEAD